MATTKQSKASEATGPWTTYGVALDVWREVANQHAERGGLPTAAQVDLATRCGTAAGQAAVEAFALFHELGEMLAAGNPAVGRRPRATGSLYLDPGDGELVQVLPESAWDPERWGPPAALPVVRILAPAPRSYNKPGEVAQRDLTGWTRVPPAAVSALRALAGASGEAPRRYATGDVECSHCRGALANGPDGLCAGCRVGLAISGVERFLTVTPDDPAHRADGLKCGSCGLDHVRLHRDYGCFLRTDDLRCNACLKSTFLMVPCVSAPDGTVWGYSSCPEADIARWYARPDASTAEGAPRWDRGWRVRREPDATDEGGS